MIFTTPWALLLLLPILALTATVGYPRLQRLPPARRRAALMLRLLLTTLLVIALSGPQWYATARGVNVVFLVDASDSVGTHGQQTASAWAAQATRFSTALDREGVVLFNAAPRLAVPLAHYRTLPDPSVPGSGSTDIAAALRLGLALLPPGMPGRLVLLSDGQPTTGDTASAVALALARHVTIDTVAIPPARQYDALLQALDIPPSAHTGQNVPIRINIHSSDAMSATLRFWIDGHEIAQAIQLPRGDSSLSTEQAFDTPGLHVIHAQIDAPGDSQPLNNTLYATTVVQPPGRILFAVSNPAAAATLATTLARARLAVTPILASSLPATPAAYRGYDEVVLDDVTSASLRLDQQQALRRAVYDGLGLVAIGGHHAFGSGQYAHTPLEQALPVDSTSVSRNAGGPLALMLVIDKSGSMADVVAGVPKIEMVKVAATSGLDRLQDGDAVGVLAFDDTNHVIVPFHIVHGAADKERIRQQISGLSADGDTYIYPALQAAEQSLLQASTLYRHIILLTDGQGEENVPFNTLIKRMHREHITVSTIGVGQDVVQQELRQWAQWGGGRFYYVSDPHDIPHIIVTETRFGIQGNTEVYGPNIRLEVGLPSPLLRSLSGQTLPPVNGYNSTTPKASAQVNVQAVSGDPVLASWQYGLGRAVAWTSDAGTQWATKWSPASLPSFWSDLAFWSLRGYASDQRAPQLQAQNGLLHISLPAGAIGSGIVPRVRIVEPNGVAQLVSLNLVTPGIYTAALPISGPGIYTAALARNDRGPSGPTATLAVPYPAEYANKGVDMAFLSNVAATTGGQVLSRPADAFAHNGLTPVTDWQPLWPWLALLALLLFPLDIAVRLLLPPDSIYRRR